jgi:hypothetical protein
MRKYYMSEYRLGLSRYTNYLLAEDKDDAERLMELRGLGEFLTSEMEITTREACIFRVMAKPLALFNRVRWETEHQWKDVDKILHQSMFLLNLGEKSGRYKADRSLFGDKDPLHELLHCQTMDTATLYEAMFTVKAWLEELGETAPELFFTPEEIVCLNQREEESRAVT